jgi:hypothetical protein
MYTGPNIITNGLVLQLDAGNTKSYPGSGTTWSDLSGNGNSGTLTNGPTFSSANGGSIVFDGVDDFIIDSTTINIPIGSSNRTVHMWVRPTTNINNFMQIGTGGGGNQVYVIQYYNISGTIYLFTDGINPSNNLTISGASLPTLNVWNHITFGNSGQNWFYYLNGILISSGTWPVTINTVGQKYVLGKRDDVVTPPMTGNMAYAQIYNRALTAAEVLQNYNALSSRFGL